MFRLLLVGILSSASLFSGAAHAAPPTVHLQDIDVVRHRTAAGVHQGNFSDFRGVRSIYEAPAGKVFLTFRVAATSDAPGSIGRDDVKLTIEGAPLQFLGDVGTDGVAELHGVCYFTLDGKPSKTNRFALTYLAPEEAKKATLTIAGVAKELDLDVPVVQRIEAGDAIEATVEEVAAFAELPNDDRFKDGTVRRFAPLQGKLVTVAFSVRPLIGNKMDGRFEADGAAFGLTLTDGTYVAPIGEIERDKFRGIVSRVYAAPNADGEFPGTIVRRVFIVPETTRSATLCYFGDPIVEAKVPAESP